MDPAHALWIGGPRGSGTSAVAAALAERWGLGLYDVDAHTAAHAPRMPAHADPEESSVTASRHRFRLVLEDLRALPDGPGCVVAGPQLFPTSVAAVLAHPGRALFLLPAPEAMRAGELAVAETFERDARELQLPVLRGDRALEETIEDAARLLEPGLAGLP